MTSHAAALQGGATSHVPTRDGLSPASATPLRGTFPATEASTVAGRPPPCGRRRVDEPARDYPRRSAARPLAPAFGICAHGLKVWSRAACAPPSAAAPPRAGPSRVAAPRDQALGSPHALHRLGCNQGPPS